MAKETIGARLERLNGIGPGFDTLRFTLAFLIFYAHCIGIAGVIQPNGVVIENKQAWEGILRPFHLILVPMFLSLGGFLVTGSLFRLRNIWLFILFRGFRIFPALIIETCISGLILGPVFTRYSLPEYFSDPGFIRYLGNLLGIVCFKLPGVFLYNPIPDLVNINLWTMPGELMCYFITIMLTGFAVAFNRRRFTKLFIFVTIGFFSRDMLAIHNHGFQLAHEDTFSTASVIYYYLMGCFFYHWRHKIAFRYSYLIACFIAGYCLLFCKDLICTASFFVTYTTVALGLMKPPRVKLIESGDYSYGIYLYGFPLTQAMYALSPQLFAANATGLFLAAGAITSLLAVLSWHVIEKPVLRLKKYFLKRWGKYADPYLVPT